jgi:hypothetical protein
MKRGKTSLLSDIQQNTGHLFDVQVKFDLSGIANRSRSNPYRLQSR